MEEERLKALEPPSQELVDAMALAGEEIKKEEPLHMLINKKEKLRGLFFGNTTETRLRRIRKHRRVTQRVQKDSRKNNAR